MMFIRPQFDYCDLIYHLPHISNLSNSIIVVTHCTWNLDWKVDIGVNIDGKVCNYVIPTFSVTMKYVAILWAL